MNWTKGRLLGFDLETTGVDPETAHIVQFGFTEYEMGMRTGTWTWPVNPGVHIPEEASAIHGMTDETNADAMTHLQAMDRIVATLIGATLEPRAVLVGMNLAYDLTIIDRHWRALTGLDTLADRLPPVLDVLVLDKHYDTYRKGSRRLEALARHYDVPVHDAHDAGADAEMSVEVLLAMADRHPEMADTEAIALDIGQRLWRAEQQRSFHAFLIGKGEAGLDLPADADWPIRRMHTPIP